MQFVQASVHDVFSNYSASSGACEPRQIRFPVVLKEIPATTLRLYLVHLEEFLRNAECDLVGIQVSGEDEKYGRFIEKIGERCLRLQISCGVQIPALPADVQGGGGATPPKRALNSWATSMVCRRP